MPKKFFKRISSHLHKHRKSASDLEISSPNSLYPIGFQQPEELATCPICELYFKVSEIENHAEYCVKEEKNEIDVEIKNEPLFEPPPLNPVNPFEIQCPYSNECGKMELFQFPEHVTRLHSFVDNHKFACPICALESDDPLPVNDSTNLLFHLQSEHADLKADNINIGISNEIPLILGTGSIEETLDHNLTNMECTICFADFTIGQVIMRLECWCIYHKECIEDWYSTIGCRVCPVHKQNEQTAK